MAEEAQSKATEVAPMKVEEAAVTEATPPAPASEPAEEEAEPKKTAEETKPEAEEAGPPAEAIVAPSVSFKEESNVVADLVDPEKKALDELKQLVQAALANNEFAPPPPPPVKEEEPKPEEPAAAAPAPEEPETEPTEPEEPPKPAETDSPAPPPEVEPPKPTAEKEEPLPAAAEDDGGKTGEAVEETVAPIATAPAAATEEVTPAAGDEPPAETPAPPPAEPPEEVFIWGVPLLGDERSDTILLKFLRARDFKVKDALSMLKNAVIWRKQFGIEALLQEDLGLPELEKAVFMHAVDREGHPVCYNVYGEFQNKELYDKAFGDEEKRQRFLKWRIQYLEKGIRELLDFTPGGVSSMVQVTDLKNTPRLGKHRQATRQAVTLLQDNYPEFIAKKVFINVPWWYLAFSRMMSPFFTQRTKSKFVFAGPSKSAETLFKYIAPEQVPVAFGGLSNESDPEFTTADAVTEVTIKASSKQSIEIPATEATLLVWELRVSGWEVSYGAEFMPSAEDGYTVIVQKTRKLVATDEPVIKTSFKIGEPGKVVLNIENPTSKKKKLLYRSKAKSSAKPT
ncbi:patellin-3 [Musa acuminata AAA Group]|uniref:patellin-3 n=1 Tax=Musa acuminata AAA Group TaxID=214697 RepID=UPI0031DD755D